MEFLTFKLRSNNPNNTTSSAVSNPITDDSLKLDETLKSDAYKEDTSVFTDIQIEEFNNKVNVAKESNETGLLATIAKLGEEKIKQLFDLLDADKNGKLTNDEIGQYSIKDGDDLSLSAYDLKEVFEKMGLEITSETPDETQETQEETIQEQSAQNASNEQSAPQMSSGETSNSPNVNSANNVSPSNNSNNNQNVSGANKSNAADNTNTLDPNSIEGLEQQKTQLQSEINKDQSEISKINDGSSDKVKSEKAAVDKAKEEMDKAIKEDDKISDELKTQKEQIETDITNKEQEISNQKTKVSESENKVSSIEGEISTLEGSLSSVPQPTIVKDSEGNVTSDNTEEINARKKELESQIKTKKEELETAKKELEEAKTLLSETLEPALQDLKNKKEQIDTKIKETASESTKQAMENYDKAKQTLESKKTQATQETQDTISKNQTKVQELDSKIQELKNEKASKTSNFDVDFNEKMSGIQGKDLEKFKAHYEQNKERYEAAAEKSGVPAELIAAIHWREGSGNFNTYFHNGDPLGKPTVHVPAGISCNTWEDSVVDALQRESGKMKAAGVSAGSTDWDKWLDFAERYNGTGYRNKGVTSPYVWAGTDKYTSGKYVADGVYKSDHIDQQLGVALMLKNIA